MQEKNELSPERWRQVKELLGAALECEPHQRPAFLAKACAGDAQLRAEVESLLTLEEEAASFIEAPAFEVSPHDIDTPTRGYETSLSTPPPASIAGQRIGPYKVLREIGHGGMGAVYLASRADDQYRKQVAIKFIKRGMDTEFVLQRFRNERQILAALDHPNIAHLLDGGTTEDGLPYLVMEYIEGTPLDTYCDSHKLITIERLKLFRQVCAAVHYAHQRLVVHRDLKPSNILVTAEGTPKLLDFGIAKLLAPELAGQTLDPTSPALRLMTPAYASPEQVRGEPITTASDVYALGVVLYELLTGHRPYRFKSELPHEIMRAICEDEPARPSTAITRIEEVRSTDGAMPITLTPETVSQTRDGQPDKLRRKLKGDVDNIVLMALRKEAQRRYPSVEQFSEDLKRHLEGLPVIARKATLGYRSAKFIQRNKWGVATAALILATLVGGIVTTMQQRVRAERRFDEVRKLAHSIMFDYHDEIAALPGSTKARERLVKDSLEYLDSLAGEAGNDITLQREIGTAYQRIGDVQGGNITSVRGGTITFANLGDTQGALESYRKALAIRERLAAREPNNTDIQQEWGTSITRMGEVNLNLGKPSDAAEYLHKAIEIYDRLLAADPSNEVLRAKAGGLPFSMSRALGNPGDANLGKGREALICLRRALANYEKLATDYPTQARYKQGAGAMYGNIGRLLFNEGNPMAALENYRKGQALDEALVKENNTNAFYRRELAIMDGNIGTTLLALGNKTEALESCRQAVKILDSLVAADPNDAYVRRDLAVNYGNLATALANNNDRVGARANFDKAVMILGELAAQSPSNAQVSFNRGLAYLKMGAFLSDSDDVPAAIEKVREAARIGEALVAIDSKNANARSMLALAYYQLGNYHRLLATRAETPTAEQLDHWREARVSFQKALDIYQDLKNKDTLNGADANKPAEIAKEIANCDAALAKRR